MARDPWQHPLVFVGMMACMLGSICAWSTWMHRRKERTEAAFRERKER